MRLAYPVTKLESCILSAIILRLTLLLVSENVDAPVTRHTTAEQVPADLHLDPLELPMSRSAPAASTSTPIVVAAQDIATNDRADVGTAAPNADVGADADADAARALAQPATHRPAATEQDSTSLAASEAAYRACCSEAWRAASAAPTEYCEPSEAHNAHSASQFTCFDAPTEASAVARGRSPVQATWYCEARWVALNTSAISIGSADLKVPTSGQRGLWKPRALLLACPLRTSQLRQPKRFGMLVRQLFPNALGELAPANALATFDAAGRDHREHADRPRRAPETEADLDVGSTERHGSREREAHEAEAERTVVFVARYSVKNFFLAHFDLLQVAAIVLHALGPDASAQARLVMLPPDKANHQWWGPQRLLWSSFTQEPPLSYVEWLALRRAQRPTTQRQRSELLPVRRALFAVSGLHSVYGRGVVGRALERVCDRCRAGVGVAPALARVSARSDKVVRRGGGTGGRDLVCW